MSTLQELILTALREDMPSGDVTTESLGVSERPGRAKLIAKQDLILSGTSVFEETVLKLEPNAKIKWHFDEGDSVLKGQNICSLHGDLIQILKAERVALNFIMGLSGIATLTHLFVQRVSKYQTRILDTRKTTPGYRDLQKRAVIHGGGLNHRMNLSSAILIKDNHIALMGGLGAAVTRVRKNSSLPIEVETRTKQDVKDAVSLKVHRILLDNMSNDLLKDCLAEIPTEIETEASGNMNLDRVESVAALGVNFISVGAITHSAPSADLSLMFDWSQS